MTFDKRILSFLSLALVHFRWFSNAADGRRKKEREREINLDKVANTSAYNADVEKNTERVTSLEAQSESRMAGEATDSQKSLLALRRWVEEQGSSLRSPTSEEFLLRFLQAADFRLTRAKELLILFWKYRTENPQWLVIPHGLDPTDTRARSLSLLGSPIEISSPIPRCERSPKLPIAFNFLSRAKHTT